MSKGNKGYIPTLFPQGEKGVVLDKYSSKGSFSVLCHLKGNAGAVHIAQLLLWIKNIN